MPKLALNGFSMYYETYGSGPPIVFIPGALGAGRRISSTRLQWFSQNYQVIAPDPRGYGESRPPERDYPLGFYQRDAEDVLALMTALGHVNSPSSAGVMGLTSARSWPRTLRSEFNGWSSGAETPTLARKRSLPSKPCGLSRRGRNGRRMRCGKPTVIRSMHCGSAMLWDWKNSTRPEVTSIGFSSAGWSARHSSCMGSRIRWYHGSIPESFMKAFADHRCMFFLKAGTRSTRSMRRSSTS